MYELHSVVCSVSLSLYSCANLLATWLISRHKLLSQNSSHKLATIHLRDKRVTPRVLKISHVCWLWLCLILLSFFSCCCCRKLRGAENEIHLAATRTRPWAWIMCAITLWVVMPAPGLAPTPAPAPSVMLRLCRLLFHSGISSISGLHLPDSFSVLMPSKSASCQLRLWKCATCWQCLVCSF